jgi:hypothetical protein
MFQLRVRGIYSKVPEMFQYMFWLRFEHACITIGCGIGEGGVCCCLATCELGKVRFSGLNF